VNIAVENAHEATELLAVEEGRSVGGIEVLVEGHLEQVVELSKGR
jgi:hypothetical protein